MLDEDFTSYDAVGLAHLVRTGQVSAAELCETVIGRIEAANPVLNAVPFKFYDKAREQIAAGLPQGPFRGVPFLLKDIAADYTGTPSTQGCSLYRDNISKTNSRVVDAYLKAGLVILGKSSTSELGLVGHVETRLHGATRNPWNTGLSSGGSSGGAAALVAARVLPATHASDGGGSIRIPAAWCGIFGLKASRARVPYGPAGEGLGAFSAPNCVSISVRDSAALLDVISGPDEGAQYQVPQPVRPYREEIGRPTGRLRIGVVSQLEEMELHPEAVAGTLRAAQLCEELGHDVSIIRLPVVPRYLRSIYKVITAVNMDSKITGYEASTGRKVQEHELEPYTWAALQAGRGMSGAVLADALSRIQAVTRQLAPWFTEYDVIVTPTVGRPPIELGTIERMGTDLDGIHELLMHCFPMTQVFNMMGYPAMSVPLHWTPDNLPMGTQFAARWGREDLLLRLAAQLEDAAPWKDRRPSLA